jgi:hypothetical protein
VDGEEEVITYIEIPPLPSSDDEDPSDDWGNRPQIPVKAPSRIRFSRDPIKVIITKEKITFKYMFYWTIKLFEIELELELSLLLS